MFIQVSSRNKRTGSKIKIKRHLSIIVHQVLSIVLCVIILCQLDRKKHTPAVAYSAEAKAGNYTTLTELPDHS